MDILGIGPLELALVLLIALLVVGPKEMVKMGSTIGKFLRKLMTSPTWKAIRDTSREISNLPAKLARQANLEEFEKLRDELKDGDEERSAKAEIEASLNAWTNPQPKTKRPPAKTEDSDGPPSPQDSPTEKPKEEDN
jgi:Sec-independent protein translocase protein TatA